MTPETFVRVALDPAFGLLPIAMDSHAARAMVVAIALQESKLTKRRQLGSGPARSYLQFERTGIRGVLKHPRTAEPLRGLCTELDVSANVPAIHRAIEFQDVLAVGLARLLLWTLPVPLPARDQPEDGYAQYVEAWQPGRPRPETWPFHFLKAWQVIEGDS